MGHPVEHSLSPAIHNAALRHAGVNAVYLAFDVPPGDLEGALRGLRAVGAAGVNVTVPHKRAALELADRRLPSAEQVGAANTLVFGPEGTVAANTDPEGILGALAELGVRPAGVTCLVLGAGGAGRAAVVALQQAGASLVLVANRTAGRARELARELGGGPAPVEAVGWEEAPRAAASAALVVNATSVGLASPASPLGLEDLQRAASGECRAVLDLVYGPRETLLVRWARQAGLRAADGLGTLVYQAAAAFELLFGPAGDVSRVMREAAWRAAGRPLPRGPEDLPPIV